MDILRDLNSPRVGFWPRFLGMLQLIYWGVLLIFLIWRMGWSEYVWLDLVIVVASLFYSSFTSGAVWDMWKRYEGQPRNPIPPFLLGVSFFEALSNYFLLIVPLSLGIEAQGNLGFWSFCSGFLVLDLIFCAFLTPVLHGLWAAYWSDQKE